MSTYRGQFGPAKHVTDIVVVGAGNAGFCAAHAAAEGGAQVLLLEKAPEAQAGGNSFYTAGAFRIAHQGIEDLHAVLNDALTAERLDDTELAPYSAQHFVDDLDRITDGHCDPDMALLLASKSNETVRWLATKGIRWRLMYERQSYVSNGKWVFFGNLALGTEGGGKGLMAQHTEAALSAGVRIQYEAVVSELLVEDGAVRGVVYVDSAGRHEVRAGATIIAAGGFEADPGRRQHHLGPDWHRALVRGTPMNTGEVLQLALKAGAAPHGDWSSCHSVAWDADAPPEGGERRLTNQLTRQSYPLGVVVNREGKRFVDEGADFRNYTYAKYGREILAQPDSIAFQLFDTKTRTLLRSEEYDSTPIAAAQAADLSQLGWRLGIDEAGLRRTVDEFNEAIVPRSFDPAIKDGRAAMVAPPKSNWALALDTPPFYGYAVRCGITFTFGGVHVDHDAAILSLDGTRIPRLYAAGELVGGLFSGNYPGGSGLTAGAVYGRLAGHAAARDIAGAGIER